MNHFLAFNAEELSAIGLTLKVALWCSLITLPLAIAFGWLLARKRFKGKLFLEAFFHLPLVLPPVTTGFILLWFLGRNSFIGSFLYKTFGIQIAFSFSAAVLAAVVVSFPLVLRSVRTAIEMVDRKYEMAARTLGAGRWRTFFTVTLPIAMPGVISGFILSFARCMGEFGATITFAGNIAGETQTLPLALFSYMQVPGEEYASIRLAIISVIIAFIAMAASELINRKNRKQLK